MKNTNTSKRAPFNTVIASSLAIAILSTTLGGMAIASNHYNNHGEQQIYRDGQFGKVTSQLRQNLRNSGYYVMDIQADGSNKINVYAKKNNQPYQLKYTYPELKLISSQQKAWSKVWQDKNQHHNGYNNYNDNYHGYNNNDVEDKIKSEGRYSAIKQRAIDKLSNQGYRVTNIELDEQDNRGVFEIEAKRGDQDYDVVLSYPELNTVKFEKD